MRFFVHLLFFLTFCCTGFLLNAQKKSIPATKKCATNTRLEQLFQENPVLRQRFQEEQITLSRVATQRSNYRTLGAGAVITIPIVFHILLSNPETVTDLQIQAQLDTLNKSFSGTNGDSTRIPAYFKPFFGKSTVQFCLAKRTPNGEETNGIVRKSTSSSSFSPNDAMKYAASGGSDGWNSDDYLNIWVCSLSDNVLGYATFPNIGAQAEQGVVIDYRSLPGGAAASYNAGKTLVHEAGHYFELFHIWGDDNGLCSGTDYVEDTPNQGNATNGCFTGIRTDNCTTTGNGIMYQNYMDYSYDQCLAMFTMGQVNRMETALATNRSSLLNSNGCKPVARKAFDVQLRTINSPDQRLCAPSFSTVLTIINRGMQTLSTVTLQAQIDNGPVNSITWNGSLTTLESAIVTLDNITVTAGRHLLTVYTSGPNGVEDEEKSNDTLRLSFQYYPPVISVNEGFESAPFPPVAWDIVNPDGGITWERVTTAAKSGFGSVKINNINYSAIGQKDDLRLPQVDIPGTVDSAFFSFDLAAATYTDINTADNIWDTLEVLISSDCGRTNTSLYKKWGAGLVTQKAPVTGDFVPVAAEWRRDSINLASYIGQSNLMLTFRNTTGYENNIYLDNVHFRTVTVNPNLKAKGYLVTPNPTRGQLTVQFYPQPTGLRSLQLFNATGYKLAEYNITNGQTNNLYTFDLTRYAAGTYYFRAVFADRVKIEKIIKF